MNPGDGALPLLRMGLPLSEDDIGSGLLSRFLGDLAGQHEFALMDSERLKECLAVGFGYPSWRAMCARECADVAKDEDLPRLDWLVLDVIAWRMYAAGYVSLVSAFIGLEAAWRRSALSLRRLLHGDCQWKEHPRWNSHMRDVGLGKEWIHWPPVALLDGGQIRIQWVAEVVDRIARSCWMVDSGITAAQLQEQLVEGSTMGLELAMERSWFFPNPWPVALKPTQFMDRDGGFVGYGWRWPELGLLHSRVFETAEDLSASAVALWRRSPTLGRPSKELPSVLVEVEYEGPLCRVDPLANLIAPTGYARRDPLLDVIPTKGSRLALGVDVVVDGEPWTRPDNRVNARQFDGVLGLELPRMEQSWREHEATQWLFQRVPFALDLETCEVCIRLREAFGRLQVMEADWIRESESVEEIAWLLKHSSENANPLVSAAAEDLYGDSYVRDREVPEAGMKLRTVYPEMRSLPVHVSGEYALGFYGKGGVRQKRLHCARDRAFMAHCVLRNLGLDPGASRASHYLGLFRLVRRRVGRATDVWRDAALRAALASEARGLWIAYMQVVAMMDSLEPSYSGSRLEDILAGNQ